MKVFRIQSKIDKWALLSSGPQYGTLERAWTSLCTEAEKVSELHMEVKAALMGEDYEKLKNWQKDAYHKQMIGGFKETKEAEDGFRKAQKPWAKKLKEVWISKICGMIKSYQGVAPSECHYYKKVQSRNNNKTHLGMTTSFTLQFTWLQITDSVLFSLDDDLNN